MRHVPEEARLARIGQHDLGPLVPALGASVPEEGQQLVRRVGLAQADEGADVAQPVGV